MKINNDFFFQIIKKKKTSTNKFCNLLFHKSNNYDLIKNKLLSKTNDVKLLVTSIK